MKFSRLPILLSPLFQIRQYQGTGQSHASTATLDEIIEHHFATYSEPNHVNRASLTRALRLLDGNPARILETGSSAWGTNSSRLFDHYVRRFGGVFVTIDIRPRAATRLRTDVSPNTAMWVGDSQRVMKELIRRAEAPFDFVYLDSFDLDDNDPLPSMLHGFGEFLLLEKLTKAGSIIVIDDTPRDWDEYANVGGRRSERFASPWGELMPGKGSLVTRFLDSSRYEMIGHEYQLSVRRLY